MNSNSIGSELEIEEIMEEGKDVVVGDQFGAGKVEFVVPTVNNELKPKLKMEFSSLDEGYTLYKTLIFIDFSNSQSDIH